MEKGITSTGGSSVKELNEFETIRVKFKGRDEYLDISGNGNVAYDYSTDGGSVNIFEHDEKQNLYQDAHRPMKVDHISHYLQLLYSAQQVDHNVHEEITEALKLFRQEAGI